MQFNVSYVYAAREDATPSVPILNEGGVPRNTDTGIPIINKAGVSPINDTRVPTINTMGRPGSPEFELIRPGQSEPRAEPAPRPAPPEPRSSTTPSLVIPPAPSSRATFLSRASRRRSSSFSGRCST